MSNRTAKFVSAIVVSILTGVNFTAVAENTAKVADSCLSGPKNAPPAGGHWYYRVDRATKRNCWYVGEAKGKTAAAVTQDSAAAGVAQAADSAAPQTNATVPKSVADARAELPSAPTRSGQITGVDVQQRTIGAASTATDAKDLRATAPDAGASSSLIASRWPDSTGASSANNPRLAAADLPGTRQADAPPAPQPATSPVTLAAADSASERQSGSIQTLLLVLAGALALAGLIGAVIVRLGRTRPPRYEFPANRRAPWDSMQADGPSPPIFDDGETPMRRTHAPGWRADIPRDPHAPDDPQQRVTQMLARLARSAAN